MTKELFIEKLSNGFNAKVLAEKVNTSEGHINELRRKPNAKAIAEAFNLNVEDVENVLKQPNLEAIYDFVVDRNVELNDEDFTAITTKTQRESKSPKIYVGLETSRGKIIQIQKIGKTNVYCLIDKNGQMTMLGTADMKKIVDGVEDEETNDEE